MHKIIYLLFVGLGFSFMGCKSGSKNDNTLSVTIEPQRYFLENLIDDVYSVNVIVPSGTSPEVYQPSPSVMVEFNKSLIYFKVGTLGFEKVWSKNLEKNNPDIKIIDCSKNIELIYGSQDHNHTGLSDVHIWASPKNAKILVENMYKGLITYHPEEKDLYKERFYKLEQKITKTDSIITALLRNIPSRSFIIYHPILTYFARDYGLKQFSMEFEGKKPSPAQIKTLIDLAEKEKIKIVFVQQGFDLKNAEVVAKEIGAKVYEINPLAYDWNKEMIRIAEILKGKVNE